MATTLSASVRATFSPSPTATAQRTHTQQPLRQYITQQQQPPQIKLTAKAITPNPSSSSHASAVAGGSSLSGVGLAGVGSQAAVSASLGAAQRSAFVERVLAGDEEAEEQFRLAVKLSLKSARGSQSQAPAPRCSLCGLSLARALLCLDCGQSHCDTHAHAHLDNTQHATFFDLRACAVYDALGEDYIYHPGLERLIENERKGKKSARKAEAESSAGAKRQKVALSRSSSPGGRDGAVGIPRGLRNLGQTCYMSVILQAFVHNPNLRNYFLGDSHNRSLCERGGTCFGCEIDRVFSEVYTSSRGPFAPTRFLYAMWQSSAELSGYAQQDAQEFLISTLNLLHAATCSPHHLHGHDAECTCVAHATFGGLLKSEVTCGHCSNVSASTDPFLDLSLDLRARSGVAAPVVMSLERCLERFTSAEGTEYSCARCGMQGKQSKASKRLRIERLPKVLAVQLKRFEHTNKSSKVEDDVTFPFQLDPAPFLADEPTSAKKKGAPHPRQVRYRLHTVVVHIGSLSTGHYVAYVLAPLAPGAKEGEERQWYFTSDEEVRPCTKEEVGRAKAYMLFYEQE